MNDSELRVSVPDSAIPNDTNDQPTTRANSGDIGNEPGPVPDAQGGEVDVGGTVGVGPGTEEISAYFKLESALFTYYCQTLVVTIGRRPPIASKADPQASGPSGEPDQDGLLPPHEILTLGGPSNAGKSEGEASGANGSGNTASSVVDVDLGQLKSVSRLHARIEYDETEACFVLAVLGRNGAWVDGEWYGGGRKAPLTARSRIQIATRVFYFVLPDTAPPRSPSPDSQCTRHSHSRTHSRSRSRTRSPDGSISVIRNTPPRQRSPSVDIMSVASAESGDETQWVDVEPPPEPVPAKGARKPPAGKGVGKGKGRDKAPAKDKGNQLDVAPTRGKGGHGKGKGKAATASRDSKRKQPDPEPSTSKSVPVASKAPSKSITAIKGTPAHLPTPDSGTEPPPQRPAITFATHCYHAIRALGGRATLAEICQWMREQYEWFTSAEGLATNWESSVRHNLSSNKAFVAHKRKEGEKGKGFYWTFDPACEASFLERERKVRPTPNQSTSAQSQTQPPAPPLLADDGTDVSIDVEAEEEDIRGTGPPKRIDTSSIIDEAKRRRAEKEERRRLKAEKRERRERREKERAMKAAKRLAAAGGPSIAPTGQPPFFFPPYGQPYPFPPFVPPQPDGENGAPPPAPFMMKGPDGQMVPMPMPPPYMVPGPDGQMVPMPMPPYMMGAPPMGGKDGKPENGQPPFMVKGPDGQMVPAPVPPYGFPPYGYPYYLPQGPYWMPYAAPDGKKDAGGSPMVIKREDLDEEKTVSPQPHAPPWTMPPGMMPYPPPPHMGMPPFGTPAPTPGTSGEVPPAASQVPAMNMAAPTPTALAPPGPPTLSTSPAPMSLPSPALGLSTASAPALAPTPGPAVPVAGPSSSAGTGLGVAPTTGLGPEAPTVAVSPAPVSTPAPAIPTPAPPPSVSAFTPTTAPTPSAPSTPVISTPVASTSTPASVSVPTPAPAPAPTLALTPASTSTSTSAPTPTPDLSKVSIPIVVASLPASYVPPPGSTPAPYMVLHEQKLWLSPEVFSKLTEERLAELRKMGMREVINTLQADIVQFLKDKMRSGSGARGRGRGRGRARGGVTPRPPATASPAPTTASPAPAEASPTAAPNIGAAEPAWNGSPVNGQGTPSPNEVGPSNQSPKLSGPAPNVDGTHTTDGSGSHTALTALTAGTSNVAGTSTGIVRAREGDDEVAPEPKKFKSDVVGTV